MAVVGQEVLSNVLGSSRVDPAVTIQHNCCAKSAKSRIKYSREAASLKMVNFTVEEKNKLQRKSKMSATWSCPAVSVLVRMWSKPLICVPDKLQL